MRRTFVMLLVISAFLCTMTANGIALTPFEVFDGSVLNQVVKRNKLIVGMEMKFFPFEYANEKGEPIGFDVEIAQLAAKELGVEIEIKDMEFSGLIPASTGRKNRHDHFGNDPDPDASQSGQLHSAVFRNRAVRSAQ